MKDNKIIAEFMRLPKVPCNIGTEDGHFNEGYKHPKVDVPIITSGMQYHTSWDWLMPVVEKIDEISDENILFKIEHNRAFIEDIENYHIFIDVISNSRIEATYKAVVEFIKEYNKDE